MKDNIIDVTPTEVTANLDEAVKLHNEIMVNGTIAAQALYELCRCLKRMRDEKLYTSLGYNDFESYCEEKANIKKRQAYSYIKAYEDLGNGFLQSNAQLGITKLELLTHIPALDRDEFMENNDVSGLSVSDLKTEIEKLTNELGMKGEQISFLQDKIDNSNNNQDEIDRLKNQIEELKKSAVPDNSKKSDKEKKAEIKAAADKAAREAVDKERKKAAEEQKKALAEKDKEYKNKIDGYEKKLEDEKKKISSAVQKQMELEEKLNAARQDNSAKFRIYFEQVTSGIDNLFTALSEIDDINQRSKFADKLIELSNSIRESAEGYLS